MTRHDPRPHDDGPTRELWHGPPQAALVRVYPDLVERTKADPQGFTWRRFELRAHTRWRATHPGAEAEHRRRRLEAARTSPRAAMWRQVARCECPSWRCDTGNGYQGGLQMDRSFQATYGAAYVRRWGGAHRWPVWAQMRAADRAYTSRGLQPWPVCGHARLGYKPVP